MIFHSIYSMITAIVLLTALSVLLMLCIRWVRYPIRQARSTAGKK